jgi:hypothetical protein
MRPCLSLLVFLGCLMLTCSGRAEQPSTPKSVRNLLNTPDGQEFAGYWTLVRMGSNAFPTYEAILADKKAGPLEVARIFFVLYEVKGDRRRFAEHAVRRLADPHYPVRCHAVRLLERIGTPAEASAVVALLADRNTGVSFSAARTLAAVGGPRELIAMDAWLISRYSSRDGLRDQFEKFRNALKKRLDSKLLADRALPPR